MKWLGIFAAIKSVADLLKTWFNDAKRKVREMKSYRERSSDKLDDTTKSKHPFLVIILVLIFVTGCAHQVTPPVAMHETDYQRLKGGVQFVPPKDGHYFSERGLSRFIKTEIYYYEMGLKGFKLNRNEEEDK